MSAAERDRELRRPARARRTTTRASRAATSPPSATRSRSPIRAKRRCRDSRRCARSPRAASRRACCRRRSVPTSHALRALGFAGSDHDVIVRAGARCAGTARRMLVGRVDVGRERGDGERVGRLRRRPRALHAGESRHAFPSRRSRRRRRRACCARSSPTTRTFACTIRCRRRRSSATKAPRTTRVSPATPARRASSSSSTAGAAFGGGPAPARYPARQTREASEAIARRHGLDPVAHAVRAAASRCDRRRRVPQRRRSPSAKARSCSATSARSSTSRRCSTRCATAVGPRFSAIVVRDDELPLADAVGTYLFNSQLLRARRRPLPARRARRMPRASRRRRSCSIGSSRAARRSPKC